MLKLKEEGTTIFLSSHNLTEVEEFCDRVAIIKEGKIVDTKMGAMPEAILEAFNLKDLPDFTKLNQYFAYVFQYIVMAGYIYAGMIDSLEFLKYFSPFHYAVPSELVKNGFHTVNIVLAFIISIVSITSTYFIYRKKDFRI